MHLLPEIVGVLEPRGWRIVPPVHQHLVDTNKSCVAFFENADGLLEVVFTGQPASKPIELLNIRNSRIVVKIFELQDFCRHPTEQVNGNPLFISCTSFTPGGWIRLSIFALVPSESDGPDPNAQMISSHTMTGLVPAFPVWLGCEEECSDERWHERSVQQQIKGMRLPSNDTLVGQTMLRLVVSDT